jgi:hypothetical protein
MEPLSREVFEVWRDEDKRFKEQLLSHVETQAQLNLRIESRLSSLETYRQTDAVKLGIFSTIVSAIIGAFVSFWRH